MKKNVAIILLLFCSKIMAQNNTISIDASLDKKTDILKIIQQTVFVNNSETPLSEVYFHNWPNSFKNKETPLTHRLIEDYTKTLYFAKESERGFTKIQNVTIDFETVNYQESPDKIDILKIDLPRKLQPKDSIKINIAYQIKIPSSKFTSYGKTKTGYHLRYWYLVPAIYDGDWQLMSNLNIDDLLEAATNYQIRLKVDENFILTSNLNQIKQSKNQYLLSGNKKTDIILNIDSESSFKAFKTDDFTIITDVLPTKLNTDLATSVLSRELRFIKEYLGTYPHDKILIDKITQEKNPIYGLNQLPDFLSPFPDVFEWDLTIFKALTRKYIENTLLLNKRTDYWLIDGLQTYLMIEYVNKYYPEIKLLGKISNIWGIRSFNFSKLKFNDKYPFVYQFSARSFLDQALTTRADSLSNFNRKIAAKYKAGLGLQYLKGYLSDSILKASFQDFYESEKLKNSNSVVYQNILESKSDKNIKWFFGDYLQTNKKIDYTINSIEHKNDSLEIVIKNKRNITAPVALYGVKNKEIKFKKWVTNVDSVKTVKIAKGDFNRVSLNYEQLYPEYNSLDNWKNINKSLLDKPIQFRFVKDIQDPYYHQLFYQPEFSYNYYDGVGIGFKLHNKPILARNFTFKIVPSYATKSKKITGYFSLEYNQYFETSSINNISYGVMASNSHYAPELSYSTFTPYVSVLFKRNTLRDVGGKSITAKLVSINKEVTTNVIKEDKDKYSILNLNYFYSKPNIIEGIQYKINADIASNFTKFSGDFRYRKLTSKDRQLDFRIFAGFFANNTTKSDYFSFGLDRPSDYLFEQLYFGRSESSGFFSQQIIISDGGFKSKLPTRFANQFMLSFNASIGLWRWMEYYNDVAFLKNRDEKTYFAYENGIRLNFVHNILEVYFPLYSNLGWEINQEAYASKIRFVLTANPTAIYNFFRRGFL